MKTALMLLLPLFLASLPLRPDFLEEQKKYQRVRDAFVEKGQLVSDKLLSENIRPDQLNILLAAYKAERHLELYAKSKNDTLYRKILTYRICTRSGQLGPKRAMGDLQVPEGFYYIDRFHPESNYHLSLGINYPNQADSLKSTAENLGGDIFIHGACITAGCLPMTDDKIKEIYLYALHARQSGQKIIPVYLFPFKMTDDKMLLYKARHEKDTALISFWENLKLGYDAFVKSEKQLQVTVDSRGNYAFRR